PAEAEPAVHRADTYDLEQHAVGVTMHDTGYGGVTMIADGVGDLARRRIQLAAIGHELPRDRVVRISWINQLGHRRGDRDGIACRDGLKPLERLIGYDAGCCQVGRCGYGFGAFGHEA